MKVSFSKTVTLIPKWNGNEKLPKSEQVTVSIKPLEMGDLIDIIEAQGSGIRATAEMASRLVPKYATIHNLEDDAGPVTSDRINSPAYLPLMQEIVAELTNAAIPSETDEKNSVAPPV